MLAAGAAAVASSPADLATWLKFLVNEGVIPGGQKRIIPEASFKVLTNANCIVSGASSEPYESIVGYGIGWQRLSYRAHEIVEHGGLAPGFCAYVAFLPREKFGIALNCNTYIDPNILRSTALGIIHRYLGLQEQPMQFKRPATNASTNNDCRHPKAPPLPLEAYSGSYFNAGYGSLNLCSPCCSGKDCKTVLAEFSAVEKNARSVESVKLVSEWARLWASHLRVVLVDENIFSFRPTSIFPCGCGADSSPFEINYDFVEGIQAEVEFVVKENKVVGFGIFGYVPDDVKLRKGGTVEEDALVYFTRTSECCQ